MKPSDYLDLAQKKVGVRSDNALGVKLKWGRSKINNYRHNRQMMDNEAARQIAEVLDIPVWQVVADMEAQRAKDDVTRRKWLELAKSTSVAGAIALSLNVLPFAGNPAISTVSAGSLNNTKYTLYELK